MPDTNSTPIKRGLSLAVGWLADRRVPAPLRRFVYSGYCRLTGADPGEARLALVAYPSLGAFFVRHLKTDARQWNMDPSALPAPCDGRIQDVRRIEADTILQAKGRPYSVAELLGDPSAAQALEGGWAWTIYLSPSDYHRVHTPTAGSLEGVRWLGSARHSVAPKVLARRPRVFVENERAVLSMESGETRYQLVMVGALNVGRIRVVGVEPLGNPATGSGTGRDVNQKPAFARGDELARFEMGSTVVLLFPPNSAKPLLNLKPEDVVRMGSSIGTLDCTEET